MKNLFLKLFIAVLFLPFFAQTGKSEPYFAIRYGYKCGQCHMNYTGGGKRNDFGIIFSQTKLPMFQSMLGSPSKKNHESRVGNFLGADLSEKVSIGANVRLSNRTVFRDTDDNENNNSFSMSEANLYLQTDLNPHNLIFYVDETVAPTSATNREAYGLFYNLPLNGHIKLGRMLLPFGWRIPDDNAFIRKNTGFNYGVSDLGIEFGLEPGPLSFSFAGSQGGTDLDKKLSSVGFLVFRNFQFGASFSYNNAKATRGLLYGLLSGSHWGRFVWMSEVDAIKTKTKKTVLTSTELLLYNELDILLTKGLNFKVVHEYDDPNTEIPNNARTKYIIGCEWFPLPFAQFTAFYRFKQDIPQNVANNDNEFEIEGQFFF